MNDMYFQVNNFSYFGRDILKVNDTFDMMMKDGNTIHLNLTTSTALAETLWILQQHFQQHNKYEYNFYVEGYKKTDANPVVTIKLKKEVKE